MANTICVEGRTMCGMERDHRTLVGNLEFLFVFTTEFFCSAVQPLSTITISLFAKRMMHKDPLIGRKEVVCEPQHGASFSYNSYSSG
jgi:hypothetical protein